MLHFGIATLEKDSKSFPAIVVDDYAFPLKKIAGLKGEDFLGILDQWAHNLPILERFAESFPGNAPAISDFNLLLPYRPRQVFCTGANYRKHVIGLIMGDPGMRAEADDGLTDEERHAQAEARMDERANIANPYIFIKLPACAVGPESDVILPGIVEKPDWELELGVVIGRRAHRVNAADAMDCIAGYIIANDVTARDYVFRRDGSGIGSDWLSGKCFPTFLPLGPYVVPRSCVPDPYDLNIKLSVNGKLYQDESTADMMIPIDRQIAFLSSRVVLEPGDIICTGSPYGNGSAFGVHLAPGDVMEGEISGLGKQKNLCIKETG